MLRSLTAEAAEPFAKGAGKRWEPSSLTPFKGSVKGYLDQTEALLNLHGEFRHNLDGKAMELNAER